MSARATGGLWARDPRARNGAGAGLRQQGQLDDLEAFVLWNELVADGAPRDGLDDLAFQWSLDLAHDPRLRIRVAGRASSGDPADRDELARVRAERVRDFLVGAGVARHRIVIDRASGAGGQARTRRVDVSRFVATSTRADLEELAPGTRVSLLSVEFDSGEELHQRPTDDQRSVALAFGGGTLRAQVAVSSEDPSVEVGFVQFAVRDVRRVAYVGFGEGARPASALLDYSRCLGELAPSRDVEQERDAFSDMPGSIARPGARVDIVTRLAPEAEVPRAIDIPGRGRGGLSSVLWNLDYVIVLLARRAELVVPIGFTEVRMRSSVTVLEGGEALRTAITAEVPPPSPPMTPGAPPGLDIDRAMSLPSARLRERLIRRGLANPAIVVGDAAPPA